MNDTPSRKIKTGGDPRTLADYIALRDELSKLTHPARPDVNWHNAEKLCLSLFEHNGVELQTLSWFTLARTHLAGLSGMNEGLAIMEKLITHQWGGLWPQPVHARMEILTGLSQRLQQLMRTMPLSYGDLGQLYLAEQQLTSLGAVLQRLELKHLSQLDNLRLLMHNSAVRLENSDGTSVSGAVVQPGVVLPRVAFNSAEISKDTGSNSPSAQGNGPHAAKKRAHAEKHKSQQEVDKSVAASAVVNHWKPFAAGMCTMLVLSVATVWGWQALHRPEPLQAQLAASLTPLPTVISSEQREALRQQSPSPEDFLTQTQQQLDMLDKLSPDWNIDYGRQLTEQAQALWPEQAAPLVQRWQQQLVAGALPAENLNGWHQGMTELQQLADRLDALDEKRGKYLTVSELKSAVFNIMTNFRQTVPAEEQLRAIHLQDQSSPGLQRQIQQVEQHLRAQAFTLMQEKERSQQ